MWQPNRRSPWEEGGDWEVDTVESQRDTKRSSGWVDYKEAELFGIGLYSIQRHELL